MDVERLIERLAVIADTSFLDHAAADDLREAAAALAKLQAERDEAIDAQFTVDENGVSIGWEEVAAMWRSRATHAEARAEKAEAERDEALRQMAVYAREAGLATGKLETSEAAGIVEGWKERAEKAEAERDAAREALRPFAEVAKAETKRAAGWSPGTYWSAPMEHFRAASRALGGGE